MNYWAMRSSYVCLCSKKEQQKPKAEKLRLLQQNINNEIAEMIQ